MSLRDPALIGITQARTPERTADALRRIAWWERKPGGGGGGGGTLGGSILSGPVSAATSVTTGSPQWAGMGLGITGPSTGVSINGSTGNVAAVRLYENSSLKATVQYQPAYAPAGVVQFALYDGDNFWAFTNFDNWDGSSSTYASNRVTCNPSNFINGGIGDRGLPGVIAGSPQADWITVDDANTGNTATFAIASTTGVGVVPVVVTTTTAHSFQTGARVTLNVTGNSGLSGGRTITNATPGTTTFEINEDLSTGTGTGGYVWADFTTWAAFSVTTDFDARGSYHAFKFGNITASEVEGIYGPTNVSVAKTGTAGKWRVTHATLTFDRLTTGDTYQVYQTGVTGLDGNWVVTKISNSVFDLDGSAGVTDPATGPYDCTARRSCYHEVTPVQGWVIQDSLGALTKTSELPVIINNSKQGRVSGVETALIEYNTYPSYNSDAIYGSGSPWKDYGSVIHMVTGQTESGFGEIGTGVLVRTTGAANIRRPFVYEDAGVELITMSRWGQIGIGAAAVVNQTLHTSTGLPALLTIAPSSPAYTAAQGIQFGTAASVTTPINLYMGLGALICSELFEAPTLRVTATGGTGYIRIAEQTTPPGGANAGQIRLYAEASGATSVLKFVDDAGVRVTLASSSLTPQFNQVGIGQAATSTALSFVAATGATGGIAFGSDINLYRSAANDLTFAGTVSPRLIFQQATGATATDPNLGVYQFGDTQPRTRLTYDGKLWFGSGAATPDVELYRPLANVLRTNDQFGISQDTVPTGATTGSGFVFGTTGVIEQMRNATGTFYRLYGNTADVVGTPTLRGRVLAAGVIWEFSAAGGNALDTNLSRTAAGILQVTNQVSATTGFLGGIGGTTVASTGLDTATGFAMRRSDKTLTASANIELNDNKGNIRLTGGDATSTISGITLGVDGRVTILQNDSGHVVVIKDDAAALGTAANRIMTSTGADRTIADQGSMILSYDTNASRWREVGGVGVT